MSGLCKDTDVSRRATRESPPAQEEVPKQVQYIDLPKMPVNKPEADELRETKEISRQGTKDVDPREQTVVGGKKGWKGPRGCDRENLLEVFEAPGKRGYLEGTESS